MSTWEQQPGDTISASDLRLLEVLTAVLLGLATIGSAWCAYQVSQWNGVETDEARISGAARIEASREFGLATQIIAYDSSSVAQYAAAVSDDNEELQAFLRNTLIRPDFLPLLDQWEAEIRAGGAPTNLVDDPDYLAALLEPSVALDVEAETASVRSAEASSNAEDYVVTTLFMATALFLAGVTASFKTRVMKIVLLIGATLVLAFAAIRLVDFPVA